MRPVPNHRRRSARLVAPLATLVLLVAACGGAGSTPAPTSSAAPSPTPAASPSAGASPSPSASASGSGALDAELKALADEIVGQVAELRELDVEQPIKTEVYDQAAVDAFVLDKFQKETPAAELAAEEGLYRRLGLLGSEDPLTDLVADLMTSQILGFYETDDATLRVVARGDGIGALEKWTMSHELTHALQDQHFDMDALRPAAELKDKSDLALARLAVAEGDAFLLMAQWATRHLTPQELLETLGAASDPAKKAVLDRTPAILTVPLQFPYLQGAEFVMAAWTTGGWAAVDRLYADPPNSTEQVLHPDKYEAREAPIKVELPSGLAGEMGSGWSVATQDTFGEYLTSLWLQQPEDGATGIEPEPAAEGWGGDRLAYLTGPAGADAVVWATAWDSAADAQEFLQAAAPIVDASAGGHSIEVDPDDPTRVWIVLTSDKDTMCAATEVLGIAACRGA